MYSNFHYSENIVGVRIFFASLCRKTETETPSVTFISMLGELIFSHIFIVEYHFCELEKRFTQKIPDYIDRFQSIFNSGNIPYFFWRIALKIPECTGKIEVYFTYIFVISDEKLKLWSFVPYSLGTVGGSIGLGVGFSLLTLVEFIFFVFDFILVPCWWKTKDNGQQCHKKTLKWMKFFTS